jgi:hypothetical protein
MSARAPLVGEVPALLRALADAQRSVLLALADAIEATALTNQPATPKYAVAKNNPIGSARGFKDACKAAAFPTFKLGRQTAAMWTDVEAYIESRSRLHCGPAPNDETEDRAALEAAGVRLRPAANDARRSTKGRR